MQALILTAGLGTRLRPLTDCLAKPAVEVNRTAMMAYPLAILKAMQVNRAVLNLHYLPETIKEAVKKLNPRFCELQFSDETDEIQGSGGAISRAAPQLNKGRDLAVINGDGVFLLSQIKILERFVQHHQRTQAIATLMVTKQQGVGDQWGGVFVQELIESADRSTQTGPVATIAKTHQPGLIGLHYVGLLLLSSRFWPMIPPGPSNLLYDHLLKAMQQQSRVEAFVVSQKDIAWFETGDLINLKVAEEQLRFFETNSSSPFHQAALKVRDL